MKKQLLTVLLVLSMLVLPAMSLADDASLTVVGTATVTLTPDMAQFGVGVSTQAVSMKDAVNANNVALNAIIDALTALGIPREDLSTSNYYVGTEYDYSVTPAVLAGYSVNNTLNVTVRNLDQVGAVIDAAIDAGANNIYGVTFLSSQTSQSHDQALTLAIQEGMRKAQLMAQATGRSLGDLEAVVENGDSFYDAAAAYNVAAARDAGATIMPETLTVTASVTLTYELK